MFSGVFRKAADAIRGTDKPTTVPGFLRPIDTDRIARELQLDKIAAERGSENLPPSTSNSLDGVEQQIVQLIESEWSWQGVEFVNNLRSYAQRLVGYSIQAEFVNLEISAKNTLAQLRAAHHRAEAELGLREQFVGLRNGLKDLQLKHRLQRIARTPARRWTTFGLLAILVAVESVLNGFFFAKGSQFGALASLLGFQSSMSFFRSCSACGPRVG